MHLAVANRQTPTTGTWLRRYTARWRSTAPGGGLAGGGLARLSSKNAEGKLQQRGPSPPVALPGVPVQGSS